MPETCLIASMYTAALHNTIDAPWTAMEPIRVGPVPTAIGTPGAYVTVERDGKTFARIDVYPLHGCPFVELAIWGAFVVIGWGNEAHLVDPATRGVRSISCDSYFGHLYPLDDRLLIASASDLICINEQGEPIWRSGCLGVDGVVVDRTDAHVIVGQGEWDPPGGWRSFRLSRASGKLLTDD